jgi:hypothetical protein
MEVNVKKYLHPAQVSCPEVYEGTERLPDLTDGRISGD